MRKTGVLSVFIVLMTVMGCGGAEESCSPNCSLGFSCVDGTCISDEQLAAGMTGVQGTNGEVTPGAQAGQGSSGQLRVDANGEIICPGPLPDGPDILVHGSCASLTMTAANSFLDSYEYIWPLLTTESMSPTFRQDSINAFQTSWYGQMKDSYQAVLSVWDSQLAPSIQGGKFDTYSAQEKEQLVLLVLIVAHGEETIQQLLQQNGISSGTGSSGGGSGAIGVSVDEDTYNDTQNAASCWASAGCDSYDSGTDTFSYDDGSYYTD